MQLCLCQCHHAQQAHQPLRRSACGLAQCQLWHDTLSLVLCLAGGSMRSSRPIRYSKVWLYVEDTKSRSKVSESEEDLANSNKLSTVASFSQSPFIVIQKLLETRASPAPWIAAITSVFIHVYDELYSECLSETIIRSSYHVDCVS